MTLRLGLRPWLKMLKMSLKSMKKLRAKPLWQGLTLVRFSSQPEPLVVTDATATAQPETAFCRWNSPNSPRKVLTSSRNADACSNRKVLTLS